MKQKADQDRVPDQLAFRLDPALAKRFHGVVKNTKRTKTSVVEECLEKWLPQMEKQYSRAA